MNYTQLKAPNLSVVGQPEMCLAYVREVFGAPADYATAAIGWGNAQYKHQGEQPSSMVAVPVWFGWQNEGHVAVSVPGQGIYSTTKYGDRIFPNVQAVATFINGVYIGWSEDVDGLRVVEPAPLPNAQTIYLPPSSGKWHLYKVGGPYNPGNPACVLGILNPLKFGGLTYNIVNSRGNGVYTINSQDFGQGDIWTNGSSVVIS